MVYLICFKSYERLLYLGIVTYFFLIGSQVQSQIQPKDSITQLPGVTLIEPAKSQSLGLVQSSVLRETALTQFGPVDFASTLNQTSGVYLLSGALNTNRITIRGVGARTPFGTGKLRLYYNNIPVTNGAGFSTIEAFDLEDLYAIEVVKGPKGAAFGSALGGALILKPGLEADGSRLENNFSIGSYQLFKEHLRFTTQSGRNSLKVNANWMDTNGYRENNSFDRKGILLDGTIGLGATSQLSLFLNHIDYTAQIPSSLNAEDFENNPTQAAFTWAQARGFESNKYTVAGVGLEHKLLNGTASHSMFYTYLDHYEPRPFNILDEFTHTYGLRSFFRGGNRVAYQLGVELLKDEYDWSTFENNYQDNNGMGSLQGDRLSDNKEFRDQVYFFGHLVLPIGDRLKAQVHLNLNRTRWDFRDLFNPTLTNTSAAREFDWILLPGAELQYHLDADKALYASISRGFSNPSQEETLTPDGLINPDIEQEKGVQYEVGARLRFPDIKSTLDIALYHMNISDLLVSERVGEDQFIGRNAGETTHNGLEVEASTQLSMGSMNLAPYISYTLNDHTFDVFVDEDNDYSGNSLTGVPKSRFNAGIRTQIGSHWNWNTGLQHVDEIPLTDANTLSSEPYTIWHTNIGYRSSLSDTMDLHILAGINNIFDSNYAQSVLINAVGFGGSAPRYYYPGNDRNIYLSLKLGWDL